MELWAFDFEVFKYDWLVVFKNIKSQGYVVIHNDNYEVKRFLTADKLLVGFNNKNYDNHILKAILCGADNSLVKEINDYIIAGNNGFQHWYIKNNKAYFPSFDIRDDMQQGLSLKAIEGHLGMPILESSVPFDIDRPLTEDEIKETLKYCAYDVNTTIELVKLRKNYLQTKLYLARLAGIPEEKVLYATNAKLTAMFLNAVPYEHKDEREYEYPKNLKKDLIPKEIIEFFDRMKNFEIPDEELFNSSLTVKIGHCPCKIGFGGIHGAINNYYEMTTENRVIKNYDVASLYPSLMVRCGYVSRNIPTPEIFENVYWERLRAKKEGEKEKANSLKLVLNTTYGAMLNAYNPLYDALMGRSVCVSGQLYLTELAVRYIKECETINLININTDGIMFSIDRWELKKIEKINKEWETRTGFQLEDETIQQVIQKDVNNYIVVKENGEVKTKGAYVVSGISDAGAFNINNNANIVKKAIIDYFVKGIEPEETIEKCNNPLEFQFIAKAGVKFKKCVHMVKDEMVPVQKVNRVYASKNPEYGTLYKIKDNGQKAKIENLPDHCVIDNNNTISIDEIDKQFYINMAWKRIDDYRGG